MPDKLTDKEIVKALECCIKDDCKNCPLGEIGGCVTMLDALDLINRLQAENERLHTEKDNLIKNYRECQVDNLKEFAKMCKETAINIDGDDFVDVEDIDLCLKEMVGEDNA